MFTKIFLGICQNLTFVFDTGKKLLMYLAFWAWCDFLHVLLHKSKIHTKNPLWGGWIATKVAREGELENIFFSRRKCCSRSSGQLSCHVMRTQTRVVNSSKYCVFCMWQRGGENKFTSLRKCFVEISSSHHKSPAVHESLNLPGYNGECLGCWRVLLTWRLGALLLPAESSFGFNM